ncbi:hypothetical protein D3C75_373410 [compost metagenome]
MIAGGGGAEHAEPAVLAGLQQIFGIGGIIGDHPAHRAAAVQQGRRPAHNLNALDQRRVEEGAVDMPGIGALADAVHQYQHATTIVPAQIDVLTVGTASAVEGQAGDVAQQIGGGAGGLIFRGGGVNHAHHHRGLKGAAGIAGSGNGHLFGCCNSSARQGTDDRQRQQ